MSEELTDLGERAIECCIEYDEAKRKIDRLTKQIHDKFEACERRQRENMEQGEDESDTHLFHRKFDVEHCLTFRGGYADWECEDCEKAYYLIQERKEARQEFGNAKIRVRAVARKYRKLESEESE